MSVVTEELSGSPILRASSSDLAATRRFKIDWDDINDLLAELFPAPVSSIPQLPARLPGSDFIFADSFVIKPFMEGEDFTINECSDGLNEYRYAEVEVSYKTLPYDQGNPAADQILSRRISISSEILTYKNIGIRWVGEAEEIKDPQATAGKLVPMIEHSLTLHRVENIPFATLRDLAGKVNDGVFEGAAAETLLFLGAEITQNMSSIGAVESEVELRFAERDVKESASSGPIGWNHAFREETGQWQELETDKKNGLGVRIFPGDKIYPLGDFDMFL